MDRIDGVFRISVLTVYELKPIIFFRIFDHGQSARINARLMVQVDTNTITRHFRPSSWIDTRRKQIMWQSSSRLLWTLKLLGFTTLLSLGELRSPLPPELQHPRRSRRAGANSNSVSKMTCSSRGVCSTSSWGPLAVARHPFFLRCLANFISHPLAPIRGSIYPKKRASHMLPKSLGF